MALVGVTITGGPPFSRKGIWRPLFWGEGGGGVGLDLPLEHDGAPLNPSHLHSHTQGLRSQPIRMCVAFGGSEADCGR